MLAEFHSKEGRKPWRNKKKLIIKNHSSLFEEEILVISYLFLVYYFLYVPPFGYSIYLYRIFNLKHRGNICYLHIKNIYNFKNK